MSIGLWDVATNTTQHGSSVTSSALAARRTGVQITFTAEANAANLAAAQTAAGQGSAFTADFVAAMATANTALLKSVTAPSASAVSVAAPVPSTASVAPTTEGSCSGCLGSILVAAVACFLGGSVVGALVHRVLSTGTPSSSQDGVGVTDQASKISLHTMAGEVNMDGI